MDVTAGSCLCTIFLPKIIQKIVLKSHKVLTSNSRTSPLRIIVPGFAIFPFIVVTPDSRAYL